jgi:transposase
LTCLAQGFADKGSNIPNVVAAVDCVILQMRAPTRALFKDKETTQTNISSQYCRKGFFATTVLAFVDARMRFLSFSINCGSSSHDSTVFACSKMGNILSRSKAAGGLDPKWVVVGDDAFKTMPHVMTPYQKTWLTPDQKNFNYELSKLRSVVECAFGVWKGKWGIFWRPLLVNQKNIAKLVEVTARLHNLCINRYVCARARARMLV